MTNNLSERYQLADCYARLDRGDSLSEDLCAVIYEARPPEYQVITLTIRLMYKRRNASEDTLLASVLSTYRSVPWLLAQLYLGSPLLGLQTIDLPAGDTPIDDEDLAVLRRVKRREEVGYASFTRLLRRYLGGLTPKAVMALMLALIFAEGLNDADVAAFTLAMTRSGEIFDYRPYAQRRNRRLLRRYPTGGVSEKVALIMPSVLTALGNELPILTTTLVGRSLGFTGGTWDKLSVIPGFTFPEPGADTERILSTSGAAICTTGEKLNPADRELYVLRSLTGTVVSDAS